MLQKRIEVNLQLGHERRTDELEENRRDMLDEAFHYARYTGNTDSYQLLSRAAAWLAHTFEKAIPAPENLTAELKVLLKALVEAGDVKAKLSKAENGPKRATL